MRMYATAIGFSLIALWGLSGCKTKPKAKITSVKIEPVPTDSAQHRASSNTSGTTHTRKIPPNVEEQITSRDPNSLLGGERGLDHVGVAVADLKGAKSAYVKLGFGKPQHGTLPNGLNNVNFYFGDTTYLELVTTYDNKKAPWIARFIDRFEKGALFLVLSVFSADETTSFIKGRGYEMAKPFAGRITTDGAPETTDPMWHTLFFKKSPLPGNPIYFIAYARNARNYMLKSLTQAAVRRRVFGHPNTAQGIKSVWMAVKDVAAAKKAYEAIGLPVTGPAALPQIGGTGVAVTAGHGQILLLSPKGPKTPLAKFLARRGEGIVGMSVEVSNLNKARVLIKRSGEDPEPYDGPNRRAVLVSPAVTYGVWFEFFQTIP